MKFLLISLIIFITTISSFNLSKKSSLRLKLKKLKKQNFQQVTDYTLDKIGISHNDHSGITLQASTNGQASEFSRVPTTHPIISQYHRPKYVEQMGYFEDSPIENRGEVEAIEIKKFNDSYYEPFSKQNVNKIYTCDQITNIYVCTMSVLCGWDNIDGHCVLKTLEITEVKSNLGSVSMLSVSRFKELSKLNNKLNNKLKKKGIRKIKNKLNRNQKHISYAKQ